MWYLLFYLQLSIRDVLVIWSCDILVHFNILSVWYRGLLQRPCLWSVWYLLFYLQLSIGGRFGGRREYWLFCENFRELLKLYLITRVLAFLWKLPRITETLPHNSRRSRKLKVSQKDSGDKHSTLLSGRTILVCQLQGVLANFWAVLDRYIHFQRILLRILVLTNYIGLPTIMMHCSAMCIIFWAQQTTVHSSRAELHILVCQLQGVYRQTFGQSTVAAGYINVVLEEWEPWWVKTLEIQIWTRCWKCELNVLTTRNYISYSDISYSEFGYRKNIIGRTYSTF